MLCTHNLAEECAHNLAEGDLGRSLRDEAKVKNLTSSQTEKRNCIFLFKSIFCSCLRTLEPVKKELLQKQRKGGTDRPAQKRKQVEAGEEGKEGKDTSAGGSTQPPGTSEEQDVNTRETSTQCQPEDIKGQDELGVEWRCIHQNLSQGCIPF